MIDFMKARMVETSSHAAIGALIMLPLLMLDRLIPVMYCPFGACLVLFLFPESARLISPLAAATGIAIPSSIETFLTSKPQGE